MMLPTRKPGSEGTGVSATGLGRTGMSRSYGPADESESIADQHPSVEIVLRIHYL